MAIPALFAFTSVMVLAGQAHADDIKPVGIGDLFWSPSDANIPEGGETMYELYDPGRWFIDADLNMFEGIDSSMHFIVSILMALLLIIGLAMTVIVGWVFRFTSIPEMEKAISTMIGGASQSLMEFVLPSCLVVGGFIAFVQHRKGGGGGGLSQIAWVLISGVVSVSLLTSPQSWVSGVDSARQVGASVTMTATAEGLGDGSGDFPFALKNAPKFTDNGRDTLLRKSQDSIWRGFVATPWCIAEFGSLEACQKYGRQVLDQGTSADTRVDYIDKEVEGNIGGASKDWVDGDTPVGRIMVLIPSVVVALLFAILLLVLAFTSLAAFLGSLLLLLTGVFFACLWVIPGRPRQWGLAWFDQLLARTLESFIATLVLGAVLSAQTATMQMFGKYGWLPTMGLSIALSVVAFQFRSVLAQIFGVRGTTGGSIAGMLATRALSAVGKGGGKGAGSGFDHRPVETLPGRSGGGGGGGGRNRPRLPTGSGGSGESADVTVTRVPPARPPAPAPLPAGQRSTIALPSGRSVEAAGGSAAGTTGAAKTGAAAISGPGPRPTPAAQAPQPRPVLPPGSSSGATAAGDRGPGSPGVPSGNPASPAMRPESGHRPNFAFRQAPVPQSPGEPRLIAATVIRSTPNRPPRRPASTSPHSFRPPVRQA
ncbi:hypothetical protein [Streptomyces sp. IMTB 1903]|uniref:hypothetical protein n=1 Tax=Streptomyces sp. IMTB 1903 TaxID=1776680 RepID=UPI000759F8A4|nr:hypothetical protein [Streptomyces sp. IMTB 1903]